MGFVRRMARMPLTHHALLPNVFMVQYCLLDNSLQMIFVGALVPIALVGHDCRDLGGNLSR